MTEQEILKSIEIVLYNAEYANKPGWGFYAAKAKGSFEGDSEYEYHNKTVELLLALHQKLVTDKEKAFLLKSLEPKVGFLIFVAKHPKISQLVLGHQDFVFMFLIKIKELGRALKMISDRIVVTSTKVQLFRALSEILTFESHTFDNAKLDEILSIVDNFQIFIKNLGNYQQNAQYSSEGIKFTPAYDIKKIDDYKASNDNYSIDLCKKMLANIKNRAYKIEHDRLSTSLLEGINYEINQDQKELQNIIVEFGFNKLLNETIIEIGNKLYDAKSKFDFKSCIDLIRALLNELCVSVALEIQNKKQIQSTLPIDSMGRARDYFRDNRINFLSQAEDDFIGKYNALISNASVHLKKRYLDYEVIKSKFNRHSCGRYRGYGLIIFPKK